MFIAMTTVLCHENEDEWEEKKSCDIPDKILCLEHVIVPKELFPHVVVLRNGIKTRQLSIHCASFWDCPF